MKTARMRQSRSSKTTQPGRAVRRKRVYRGLPFGPVVNCKFRVMVSSDAQQKTYPLDVLVYYKDDEGDYVNSPIETIGFPIGEKVDFNVTP